MTESKRKAEVRALVRRATAYMAQQSVIDGSYLEHVIRDATITLDVGAQETRRLIAEEIQSEAALLDSRATERRAPSAKSAEVPS